MAEDHPVVGAHPIECLGDPAVREVGDGVAFPADALASVLRQRVNRMMFSEVAEEPAGVDLRELLGIPDEDYLRPDARRVIEKRCEGTGADHPRFIDHQHCVGVQLLLAVVEVELKPRDRRGRDPGSLFELMRG